MSETVTVPADPPAEPAGRAGWAEAVHATLAAAYPDFQGLVIDDTAATALFAAAVPADAAAALTAAAAAAPTAPVPLTIPETVGVSLRALNPATATVKDVLDALTPLFPSPGGG